MQFTVFEKKKKKKEEKNMKKPLELTEDFKITP
jgi:hypothetical protein